MIDRDPILTDSVPDSERVGFIGALPSSVRPFAALMRIDRPIGSWLLFWPCAWSVALAGIEGQWSLFALFAIGAFVMRSAGCAYNDIVDRDLDARVERTRTRPLASGRVSVRAAWALVVALSLVGLLVVLMLPRTAQIVALTSLLLVAAYPFMKRITWWPQAWLGLIFSWGALVGWPAATGGFALPALLLWLGSVMWVIGYDTLYAIQDIEDDALAGIKSSARALGPHMRLGIGISYALALSGWGAAIWAVRPQPLALIALLPAALHLGGQVARLDPADGARALALFRSNRFTGLLLFAGFAVIGLSPAA